MNKIFHILLMTLLVFSVQIFSQVSSTSFDSVVVKNSDGTNYSKKLYTFNEFHQIITSEEYVWESSKARWVGVTQKIYAYPNTLNTLIYTAQWDRSANYWVTTYKTELQYDDNGKIIKEFSSIWKTDKYIENFLIEYTYNVNGETVETAVYYWDGKKWVVENVNKNIFDSNGNKIEFSSYKKIDDELILYYQNLYTVDALGTILQSSLYSFNNDSNKTILQTKSEYTKDSVTNIITETTYEWSYSSNCWILNSKSEMGYDESENVTHYAYLAWDNIHNCWVGYLNYDQTFDENHEKTSETNYVWIASISNWVVGEEDSFDVIYFENEQTTSYCQLTVNSSDNSLLIYPNPFRTFFTISYSVSSVKSAEVVVYNENGNVVYRSKFADKKGSIQVDSSTFTTGIYHTYLMVDGEIISKFVSVKVE